MKANLIKLILRLFGALPLAVGRFFGRIIGYGHQLRGSSLKLISEKNIQLCMPELTEPQQQRLVKESLAASGQLFAETAKIWTSKNTDYLNWVEHVEMSELNLDKARGHLIISPHLGNWELLYAYLAWEFNAAGIYKPPKVDALEPVIQAARERTGGEMIKATPKDVRKILKRLAGGGSVFMLPDQLPAKGSGVFAPFFGQPAYTMTLIQGLLKKTNCQLSLAICVRTGKAFTVRIQPLVIDLEQSKEDFSSAVNQHLEAVIKAYPEQYEWAYKRFKVVPDGQPRPY